MVNRLCLAEVQPGSLCRWAVQLGQVGIQPESAEIQPELVRIRQRYWAPSKESPCQRFQSERSPR